VQGYFDHNATTPLFPEAREAWLRVQDRSWHNASSLYREAGSAKRVLEDARETVADALDCEPEQILFTSGATESNNALVQHYGNLSSSDHPLLTSAIEHPSVSGPAALFPNRGDLDSLDQHTPFVSMMAANNESGELLSWRETADRCRALAVPFHVDASQWIGRLDPSGLGRATFVTGSAHKLGGPKGVGFLMVPEDTEVLLQQGGPQESSRRAGTEDVAGAAAMAAALEVSLRLQQESNSATLAEPRDDFESALLDQVPGARVIAGDRPRLWNTSLILLPGTLNNLRVVTRLSAAGFAASTGAACSAGVGNPSPVLAAEGIAESEMGAALRFSSGWETEAADWGALLQSLLEVLEDVDS